MAGPVNPDTITFDAPVAFTDGTQIPVNAIARYEYVFSQSQTGPWSRVVSDTDFTPNPQGKQTHEIDLAGFAFGQWYAASRAVTTAAFGSMTSALSNVAPFEVQARAPGPPTNFSVG
jgi:hypothetical protein